MSSNIANEFSVILSSLLSPENDIRKAAEEKLNCYPVDLRILYLFNTFHTSENLKASALVTLRTQIGKLSDEDLKSPNIQTLKSAILEALLSVTDENLLTKLCSVVSKLNSRIMSADEQFWDELVVMLRSFVTSNDTRKFSILFKIMRDDPYLFGKDTENIAATFVGIFNMTFSHAASNPMLCVDALDAFSSFSDELSSKKSKNSFMALSPVVIAACRELFKNEEAQSMVYSTLAVMLDAQSWLFANNVNELLTMLLEEINSPKRDEELEDLSSELFECIISVCEHMPGAVRKNATALIPQIVLYSFKLMIKIDEEEVKEWLDSFSVENDPDEDYDYYENASYGETSLDRLCLSLKGKAVYNNIWDIIKNMQPNSADWRVRYASVASIGCISEGCKKNIKANLVDVTSYLVERLSDQHPKVVFAALNSIGQLANDFLATYVKQFHSQIISPIIQVALKNSFVKVRAQAVIAFINLIDGMDAFLWSQYNMQINETIMTVLKEQCANIEDPKSLFLFNSVSSALTTLAEHYSIQFVDYLPAYISIIFQHASKLMNPIYAKHLGRMLSTCVMIGSEAGAAAFTPYSEQMVHLIQGYYNAISHSDAALKDTYTMEYLTLVAEFSSLAPNYIASNMSTVVPILINYLRKAPDIKLVEGSQPQPDLENYSSIKIDDDNSIVYRNDITGDIEQACTVITTIAESANHALLPYIEQLLEVMNAQCTQVAFSAAQIAITGCFPTFIKIASLKDDDYARKFFTYSIDRLRMLIENLNDFEICTSFIRNIADSFCAIKVELVHDKELQYFGQQIFTILKQVIQEEQELMNEKNELDKDEYGFDDDEYDKELVQDLLDEIQISVGGMMRQFGPRFFGPYETFLPMLMTIIDNFGNSRMLLSFAYAQLCDLIEHSKPLLVKYHQNFIPRMVDNILSEVPDIRQSCAFSIGVMASHQVPEFVQMYLTKALANFSSSLQSPSSKDPEFSYATANCIASVGRLIKFAPSLFENSINDAVTFWFNLLPVVDDEVDFILSLVTDLIKNKPELILQNPRISIHHVLMVLCVMIVEVSSQEIINEALKMINYLKTNDVDSFNVIASKLEPSTISRLEDLFKSVVIN